MLPMGHANVPYPVYAKPLFMHFFSHAHLKLMKTECVNQILGTY